MFKKTAAVEMVVRVIVQYIKGADPAKLAAEQVESGLTGIVRMGRPDTGLIAFHPPERVEVKSRAYRNHAIAKPYRKDPDYTRVDHWD